MKDFFTEYRCFFERLHWLSRWGYNPVTRSLAGNLALLFHTRRASLPTVIHNLQAYLDLEEPRAKAVAHQWLKLLGVSALNIFFYRGMTRTWVEKYVQISNSDLLNEMIRSGGLLLTYHNHHHHNTVGCIIGLLGGHISILSAAKNPEHDHAEIRKFHIDIMHDESEKKFGGGCYLYLKDPIKAMRKAKQSMGNGRLVGMATDFPSPLEKNLTVNFLGHHLSVQPWLFNLAEKKQAPLYFCLLESPDLKSQKPLYLALGCSHAKDATSMAQDYFGFLEQRMRVNPSAWQGWEWVQMMAIPTKYND